MRSLRLLAAAAAMSLTACADLLGVKDIAELTVMEERKLCYDLWGGEMSCLLVLWRGERDTETFFDHIEGFEFEPGVRQLIRVERIRLKHPPQDGSIYRYRLIEVIARMQATPIP